MGLDHYRNYRNTISEGARPVDEADSTRTIESLVSQESHSGNCGISNDNALATVYRGPTGRKLTASAEAEGVPKTSAVASYLCAGKHVSNSPAATHSKPDPFDTLPVHDSFIETVYP